METLTQQPVDLTGRIALVTGATSGLGLVIARTLARSGCDVVLNYAHDRARAQAALSAVTGPGKAYLGRADVSRAAEVAGLLDDIRERHGRLDILVHSAVVLHPMAATAPDADRCAEVMDVALGPLTHGAARLAVLLTPGAGRVIAITSRGARHATPAYVSLGMAKAALESLVRYLAADLAGRGVTVNAVSPGKLDEGPGTADPALIARLIARTPAGRLTRAQDVADVVTLLCRPEAGWIHGQVINVDGGTGLLS